MGLNLIRKAASTLWRSDTLNRPYEPLELFDDGTHRLGGVTIPRLFDDFLGDTIQTALWGNPTKGSDGATVDFAFAAGVNGLLKGTTGAGAGATMAVNGIQIDSQLSYKANSGGLVFECRAKLSAITAVSCFIGLSDQIASLEAPVTLSVVTFTTNATDAVGFLFDTNATTDTIRLVGVANDVDATMQDTSDAWVADTFYTFRIEVTAGGVATFYMNGAKVGTEMAGAVTPTIALTPYVSGFSTAAASRDITLDYILTQSNRV